MSEIEVLELVLNQIGELRIPVKEKMLREQLETICHNLDALREAFINSQNEARTESQSKEVSEDVQSDRDAG